MRCPDPDCGGRAYVTEIRHGVDYIERKRRCGLCGLRFTTRETYADGDKPERKHLDAPVMHPDLSPRECEVLALMAEGRTNKEIGVELGISAHTVKQHCGHIFSRLGVETRLEAALWAVRHGAEP